MAKKKPQTDKKPKQGKAGGQPATTDAQGKAASAAPGDASKVRVEHISMELPCPLTADDVALRAQTAARLVADRAQKRSDAKDENKRRKLEIAEIEAKIDTNSREVREGLTQRMVKCERTYYYETKRVVDIRLDNGGVVHDREMTDAELQTQFPFDGEGGGSLDDEFGGGEG